MDVSDGAKDKNRTLADAAGRRRVVENSEGKGREPKVKFIKL